MKRKDYLKKKKWIIHVLVAYHIAQLRDSSTIKRLFTNSNVLNWLNQGWFKHQGVVETIS